MLKSGVLSAVKQYQYSGDSNAKAVDIKAICHNCAFQTRKVPPARLGQVFGPCQKNLRPPAVDSQMYCSSSLLFETTRTFSDTRYEPQATVKKTSSSFSVGHGMSWHAMASHYAGTQCFDTNQDAGCRSLPQTDLSHLAPTLLYGLELSLPDQCSTMKGQ